MEGDRWYRAATALQRHGRTLLKVCVCMCVALPASLPFFERQSRSSETCLTCTALITKHINFTDKFLYDRELSRLCNFQMAKSGLHSIRLSTSPVPLSASVITFVCRCKRASVPANRMLKRQAGQQFTQSTRAVLLWPDRRSVLRQKLWPKVMTLLLGFSAERV